MADRAYETVADSGLPVKLPSGSTFHVLTQDEVDYIKDRVQRYLSDNKFVNVSDLQDVDRMIQFELFCHRYSSWLSKERDYWDEDVDEKALRSTIRVYSAEIRDIKKSLGIDKVARDKERGDDSVSEYLTQLRIRAREFGVMREEQLSKALDLFKELQALVGRHDRSDETERREFHCTLDDIHEWMNTVAFPEFERIDEHFRANKQRFWVRRM
jgi:hypothetical protein